MRGVNVTKEPACTFSCVRK